MMYTNNRWIEYDYTFYNNLFEDTNIDTIFYILRQT